MKYEGYVIGPVVRRIRKNRGLSIYEASELTGMSISSLNQIEQGGRNMSMKTLFLFMSAYKVDANTVLDIESKQLENSVDSRLAGLPEDQRKYFANTFLYMLDNAGNLFAGKAVG